MSLSSQNNKNDSSSSNSIADRQEEIKKVRQRQQDLANERATEAAKIRKVKEAEERERKKNIARKKHDNGGTRLGTTSISNTTKPQTSTSTPSSYRYVHNTECTFLLSSDTVIGRDELVFD